MDKEYLIKLEGKPIGVTRFEYADLSMEVVVGTLQFSRPLAKVAIAIINKTLKKAIALCK